MGKIRATPHGNMLAKVDQFTGRRVRETARPTAEPGLRFKQCDAQALRGERHGRGKSRQAAADDDNAFFRHTY